MELFKKNELFILALMIGLLLGGDVVMGQQGTVGNIPGVSPVGPTNVSEAVDILRAIVRWVYIIFFILAVLFILFAAFAYLTAGGDPEKVGQAKNRIIYAAVAIAVALLAVSFEVIIRNFLAQRGVN